MNAPIGSPQRYLASSVTEQTLAANSEQRPHSVPATLEQCRAAPIESRDRDTSLLGSVAILELRMKLNRLADSELKARCDARLPDEAAAERSQEPTSPQGPGCRPLLELVR